MPSSKNKQNLCPGGQSAPPLEAGEEGLAELSRILAISPDALRLWDDYTQTHDRVRLTLIGYDLVRAGVSATNLTIFLEKSGIDTNGAMHIGNYIARYNYIDAQESFEKQGETVVNLSSEQKSALTAACNAFRDGRRESDAERAGRGGSKFVR